jgi:hypothetical protein
MVVPTPFFVLEPPLKAIMNITVEIPDAIAGALAGAGQDPPRAVLEAVALEGYRRQVLGESAVRRLLGFETRMEVHAFLKEHGVYLNYSQEDLEHDLAEARRYPNSKGGHEPTGHRAG